MTHVRWKWMSFSFLDTCKMKVGWIFLFFWVEWGMGKIGKFVTPRLFILLQKGVSENFDFHVTLRHYQNYKLAAEYIFF
jgi:hypothetical protein